MLRPKLFARKIKTQEEADSLMQAAQEYANQPQEDNWCEPNYKLASGDDNMVYLLVYFK